MAAIFLNFLALTVLLVVSQNVEGSPIQPDVYALCPSALTIYPCLCNPIGYGKGYFRCSGASVTEAKVVSALKALRKVNNIAENETLTLLQFVLSNTELTSFNMSALYHTRMAQVTIVSNPKLETLTMSPNAPLQSINAGWIELWMNHLTDEGLGETLRLFSPNAEKLHLGYNKLTGSNYDVGDGSGDIEFFPGLSSLVNLAEINLGTNKIFNVAGGQFKKLNKLTSLLLSDNGDVEIGDDAFLFDAPPEGFTDKMTLYLSDNSLNNDNFNANHRINEQARQIELWLGGNNFELIGQEQFESYLDSPNLNEIVMLGSKFLICDDQMSWLKARAAELETRVMYADCSNDPGKTVFTTELIHV